MAERRVSERAVVLLIAAVQFINILDFVMVMPLGPDFAKALGIDFAKLGMVAGSYMGAAAVSGYAGSFFLDRFDRRRALAVAMLGLVTGTALGGVATGLHSLMMARLVAGLFGGPATSLAFAIIADVVPNERRGKAMGMVMSAFSIASVLGLPAGLKLAQLGGWRAPFFAVAGLGLVIAASAIFLLPPMRGHLSATRAAHVTLRSLLSRTEVRLSYAMTAITMSSGFILIPNISAYVQQNLGFPRERLGLLYLFGGLVSFVSTNAVGRLVDRYGAFRVGTFGALLLTAVLFVGFASYQPAVGLPFLPAGQLPIYGLFICFMLAMSFRNVSYNTLTTKVPTIAERARFMSIQSSVQNLFSFAGAFLPSFLLVELPDHSLSGIPRIASVSMALSLAVPFLLRTVENRVRRTPAAPAGNPASPAVASGRIPGLSPSGQ
jgi:predicted MFS family arabinose efflux permease